MTRQARTIGHAQPRLLPPADRALRPRAARRRRAAALGRPHREMALDVAGGRGAAARGHARRRGGRPIGHGRPRAGRAHSRRARGGRRARGMGRADPQRLSGGRCSRDSGAGVRDAPVAALAGLGGAYALYEAGEHGGELVYTYAGGVGIRTGDSTDVTRLYLAGLYQQTQLDRRQGKAAEAAGLFAQMARQFPDNLDVQLLAVESLITDAKDGKSALAVLGKLTLPPDDRRLALRRDFLAADAWALANKPDSARAILERLQTQFPDNPRIKDRLQKLPAR